MCQTKLFSSFVFSTILREKNKNILKKCLGIHKKNILKEIVHPKMTILSSFAHPQAVAKFFSSAEHKIYFEEAKQLTVAIEFQ